jgi:hypothetical protein
MDGFIQKSAVRMAAFEMLIVGDAHDSFGIFSNPTFAMTIVKAEKHHDILLLRE